MEGGRGRELVAEGGGWSGEGAGGGGGEADGAVGSGGGWVGVMKVKCRVVGTRCCLL